MAKEIPPDLMDDVQAFLFYFFFMLYAYITSSDDIFYYKLNLSIVSFTNNVLPLSPKSKNVFPKLDGGGRGNTLAPSLKITAGPDTATM